MRVRFTLYGAVLALAAGCAGQTPASQGADRIPTTTFKVGTDLVLLNVSVFDAKGELIKGLPKSAFTVYENNVKQEISVFRQEDVPVSLGLLIDNSASMRNKRDRVASAALAMIKASNPQDEVFVIDFDDTPELVQDFTGNIGKLEKTLNDLKPQGATAMRDAVLLGIEHLRAKASRDKHVLVVITDGEDNASIATEERLIEAARQSNAIVYAIGLLGEEQQARAERTKTKLEELTHATGGRAWFPANVSDIAAITPEIAHEIRNQYVVGYTPSDLTKDGKFRTIRVEVNVPGATVRTRSGYYARP